MTANKVPIVCIVDTVQTLRMFTEHLRVLDVKPTILDETTTNREYMNIWFDALDNPLSISPAIAVRSGRWFPWYQHSHILIINDDSPWHREELTAPRIDTRTWADAARAAGYRISVVRIVPKTTPEFVVHHVTRGIVDAGEIARIASETAEQGLSTVVIFNRIGSWRMLECGDCGFVATCAVCGTPLRNEGGGWVCPIHASLGLIPMDTCPTCHSTSWRMSGMGIAEVARRITDALPDRSLFRGTQDEPGTETKPTIIYMTRKSPSDIAWKTVGAVVLASVDADLSVPSATRERDAAAYLRMLTGLVQSETPLHIFVRHDASASRILQEYEKSILI